jgi:hypothetical protein
MGSRGRCGKLDAWQLVKQIFSKHILEPLIGFRNKVLQGFDWRKFTGFSESCWDTVEPAVKCQDGMDLMC